MKLFGQHDPTGGDGYIRGAWDEVMSCVGRGEISDEAYEKLSNAVKKPKFTVKKLAKAIHNCNEWQYGECDHGTYTGGLNHGEPYEMCKIFAKHILEPDA